MRPASASAIGSDAKIVRHGALPRLVSDRVPFALTEDGDLEALGPVEARRARLTPGVAGVLHVPEGGAELLREPALLEHRVAANLDDRVNVLDEHRAALDAPAAGRALPDGLLGDRVVHQRQAQRVGGALLRQSERLLRCRRPAIRSPLPRPLGRCGGRERRLRHKDLVAQPLHQVLRRERLAGDRRGAELHASAALCARQRVEQVPPGQVLQAPGAEDGLGLPLLGLRLEVHQPQGTPRLEALRVDIRLAADDVQVLAERQIREEAEHEEDVGPGHRAVAGQRRLGADTLQREAQRPGQQGPRARRVVGLDNVGEGIPDQLGQDDEEDQAEDDEGVAGEREPSGAHDHSPDHVVRDRCEHQPDEDVREDDDDAPEEAAERPADDRLHQAVRDVAAGRGQQHDEPPEDEGVGQAGTEVLEQATLPEDEDAERLDPLDRPTRPVQRTTAPQDRQVPTSAPPERDDRRHDGDDDERIERNARFHGSAPW